MVSVPAPLKPFLNKSLCRKTFKRSIAQGKFCYFCLLAAGPDLGTECLLQSIAAALHLSNQPLTGQGASRSAMQKNPAVNINTEQPLVQVNKDINNEKLVVNENSTFTQKCNSAKENMNIFFWI